MKKKFYQKMIVAFNEAMVNEDKNATVTKLAEAFSLAAKQTDPTFNEWGFWKGLGFD